METRLKDRKQVLANMFLSLPDMAWNVMMMSIVLSQEILAIDVFRALKSSLKHRRKHILRSLRLYRDQA